MPGYRTGETKAATADGTANGADGKPGVRVPTEGRKVNPEGSIELGDLPDTVDGRVARWIGEDESVMAVMFHFVQSRDPLEMGRGIRANLCRVVDLYRQLGVSDSVLSNSARGLTSAIAKDGHKKKCQG